MPKKNTDYSKTVIYKIVCKDLTITELYVGHTINFIVRKNKHKTDCKKKELLIYKTINNTGGWDNWDMIEIEKYPCNDGNEARTRERFWYEELNAKLNIRKPIISLEEKDQEQKEYMKQYRQENKELLTKKTKEYYEENKEQLIEKMKEYNESNKETIKEYKKDYYATNKNKLLENITCECGCIIIRMGLARHKKTSKHLKMKV